MIAREWKARCPAHHLKGFIDYLYQTGVKDTAMTPGFRGAQIFTRELEQAAEVTLITFWEDLQSVSGFAGDDIETARLYPEDEAYELEPDTFVRHYQVVGAKMPV